MTWFNNEEGRGLLRSDGFDVVCLVSSIDDFGCKTLPNGATVEFDLIDGQNGPMAHRVRESF